MLERVALHQTRLRTPGLTLDARGIALGARGMVLFPTLDRVVAFFAVYSASQTLDDLAPTLRIEIVKSALGSREVVLSFAIDASERLDGIAAIARLTGGHTFTGSGRHWVQYRDVAAPFGYDLAELQASEAQYVLYHQAYTQAYEVDRPVDLRALLLRLRPALDPDAGREPGARWILAEPGTGAALVTYLRRSGVAARAGLAEWPPPPLEDAPIRRYLFDVPALPARMLPLLTTTPGMGVFVPVAPGAAVEVGHRHPVQLQAIPAFRGPELVLFRGHDRDPWVLAKVPTLADVRSLARIAVSAQPIAPLPAEAANGALPTRVPLRLVPSAGPGTGVSGTWVPKAELPLLRRLFYLLGRETLRRSTIALTATGAFVQGEGAAEVLPIGRYYREVAPSVFVPAGFDTLPAVSPAVLADAIDAPPGAVVLLGDDKAYAIDRASFVPLEQAVLEGHAWAPLPGASLELEEALPPVEITVAPIEGKALKDVKDEA